MQTVSVWVYSLLPCPEQLTFGSSQGIITTCSSKDGSALQKTFTDVLNDIFHFSRDSVQQFFIVNIKSENVAQPVETKEVEAVIDELCKFHTEATAGTDEFVKKEVNDDASYWT